MKLTATAALTLGLSLGFASPAVLANEPTEKDAIAMCERGAALIKSKGKEEMMKRINAKDPDFVQGALYIDIRDIKTGIVLAHPYNPSIVGKDLTDVPDANGKKYRRDHRAGRRQGQGLGRLPVQESDLGEDRAEDHVHPAGGRCGAGGGDL